MNDRAVFLDRDGVLMRDANYVGHVDQVELIDGAPQALRRLQEAGFHLFVVTNQSGVGRGYFTREAVEQIHALLNQHFAAAGAHIERYYVCPHHPEDHCDCRKPNPKFLREAAREYGLELARCFMVGDRPSDIQCGVNAGTQTILVRTGVGQETLDQHQVAPTAVVADIGEAVEWILRHRLTRGGDSGMIRSG
jgi:D-glycero-D-manno-heptose 1,7-bisphosphate phosphatase